ncbi:MAG: hypothetical protein LUQ40_07015 [Methanomicrobiales archaeon]|nr:hypothetical protein [Methanomicrobiales archaeon]
MRLLMSSRKKVTGIEVTWKEAGATRGRLFSYADLIDMHINAIDLLDHPQAYQIEEGGGTLVATSLGCCT